MVVDSVIHPEPCCGMTPMSFDDLENSRHSADFVPASSRSALVSTTVDEDAAYRKRAPFIHDAELSRHYKAIQKRHLDVVSVLPLAFLYYCNAICRFNLRGLAQATPLYVTAFVLLLIFTIIFSLFLCSHVFVYNTKSKHRKSYFYRLCERCLINWFGGRIEDTLGILCVLVVGTNLVARMHQGQCDESISIWDSQSCNPLADAGSVPTDQILVLYAIPIGCQIVMRGLSAEALLVSWLGSIGFVLYCVIYVKGWLHVWTIVYSVAFLTLSFEVERLLRQSYIQSRAMLNSETQKLQVQADAKLFTLNNLHKVELLKVTAENDKKLRESESLQLRSLMGNVAHDLKTPLHSIEADMEVLRSFFSRIPAHILLTMAEEYRTTCASEIMDPQSLFNSLNATCKFMEMAINRSQDYMKASSNIVLVPKMETFEFQSALSMSVTCINHLQTSREIIVHPCDIRMCSHLISDKHWICENVLCLLSNAIKYSDDGVIDVRIELIEVKAKNQRSQKSGVEVFIRGRSTDGGSGSDDEHTLSLTDLERSSLRLYRSADIPKAMVLVTVEDRGIGISKAMRRSLFQPFKQAQRMAGGTGLGLYSLSKRIEALEGSCGVSSRSDGEQGSMFWFAFPYRPDESAVTVPDTDCKDGDRTPVITASDMELMVEPLRILVVDDSISVLKVTCRLLKMNGHSVETASNGHVGLERLKKGYDTIDFDMVLTDLQMPVMDGIEAAKRFRKYEQDRFEKNLSGLGTTDAIKRKEGRLMFVGMSANADDQSKQDALDAGMDYFITKPFAYKDLAKLLSKYRECKDSIVYRDNLALSGSEGEDLKDNTS
jgi:signal transduction histidine kinase/CheY-like chemotaxis protein